MSAVPSSELVSPWPDYDRQVGSLSDWLVLTTNTTKAPVVVGDIANIEETVGKCTVSECKNFVMYIYMYVKPKGNLHDIIFINMSGNLSSTLITCI